MTQSDSPDCSPAIESRPTVFIDRDTGGKNLREFLACAGLNVVLHTETFVGCSESIADHKWLTVVGNNGWMVVTGDQRMTRDFLFLNHLKSTKAHVFILLDLSGGSPRDKSNRIIEKYGLMAEAMKKTTPPALWKIGENLVLNPCDFEKILGRRGNRPMPPS